MNIDPEQVKGWGAIGVAILSITGWIHKVRSHSVQIKELQKAVAVIPEDIKRRLYDKDSQPIYQPAKQCDKRHNETEQRRREDIARLETKLDTLINLHMKK